MIIANLYVNGCQLTKSCIVDLYVGSPVFPIVVGGLKVLNLGKVSQWLPSPSLVVPMAELSPLFVAVGLEVFCNPG